MSQRHEPLLETAAQRYYSRDALALYRKRFGR